MQEYEVKIGSRKYILNNNSGKYDRIFDSKYNPEFVKGEQLTNEQILACYDKFAGRIIDEKGQKVPSGQFWRAYQSKLTKQNWRKKNWDKIKKVWDGIVKFGKDLKVIIWVVGIVIICVCFLVLLWGKLISSLRS